MSINSSSMSAMGREHSLGLESPPEPSAMGLPFAAEEVTERPLELLENRLDKRRIQVAAQKRSDVFHIAREHGHVCEESGTRCGALTRIGQCRIRTYLCAGPRLMRSDERLDASGPHTLLGLPIQLMGSVTRPHLAVQWSGGWARHFGPTTSDVRDAHRATAHTSQLS